VYPTTTGTRVRTVVRRPHGECCSNPDGGRAAVTRGRCTWAYRGMLRCMRAREAWRSAGTWKLLPDHGTVTLPNRTGAFAKTTGTFAGGVHKATNNTAHPGPCELRAGYR
jgi:hypothetical protein